MALIVSVQPFFMAPVILCAYKGYQALQTIVKNLKVLHCQSWPMYFREQHQLGNFSMTALKYIDLGRLSIVWDQEHFLLYHGLQNFPNLNFSKTFWGAIARRVSSANQIYSTLDELKTEIKDVWVGLNTNFFQNVLRSRPRRLLAVIDAKRGYKKYWISQDLKNKKFKQH